MRRLRLDVDVMLAAAAVFAAAFLTPQLGAGVVIADVFILALIVLWLPNLGAGHPRIVLDALLLPMLLILLGSLIGSVAVGIQPWVVIDMAKDVGAFASLLAMVVVLRRAGARALAIVGVTAALAAIIVGGQVLSETGLRARAGFPNPNVAAHFLGANLIVLARSPVPRWLRVAGCAVCIAGLVATGSFGALLMIAGAFAYLLYSGTTRTDALKVVRYVLPAVVLAGFVVVMANLPATTDSSGFNSKHFERSSTGRQEKWAGTVVVAAQHPLGIGPGSNRALGLLPGQQEAHSEYLAFLTERGVIGLVGLLLLYGAMWRLGRPKGLVRALVIGFALQSVVRETLHYRHLWLLLAFAIVLDEAALPARRQARARTLAVAAA